MEFKKFYVSRNGDLKWARIKRKPLTITVYLKPTPTESISSIDVEGTAPPTPHEAPLLSARRMVRLPKEEQGAISMPRPPTARLKHLRGRKIPGFVCYSNCGMHRLMAITGQKRHSSPPMRAQKTTPLVYPLAPLLLPEASESTSSSTTPSLPAQEQMSKQFYINRETDCKKAQITITVYLRPAQTENISSIDVQSKTPSIMHEVQKAESAGP
ncbi:uncharacterized protein [Ambystoma mexicanum]|uniref:uncharacterized protein n=1 Tax=Ambystoma mexicanum TaxID=8296 RepID=UPI0037E854CA